MFGFDPAGSRSPQESKVFSSTASFLIGGLYFNACMLVKKTKQQNRKQSRTGPLCGAVGVEIYLFGGFFRSQNRKHVVL